MRDDHAVRTFTFVAVAAAAVMLGGCFDVAPADLFVMQRTGPGRPLTAIVSDGATVRCNGRAPVKLTDAMLLSARDLADALDKDVTNKLRLPRRTAKVYAYSFKLQDGTLAFPDVEAQSHVELGRAELFAAQIANGPCAGT